MDHVRHGLAQTLGIPIGIARAGTKESFLHLLYEDSEHRIQNIAEAILRGIDRDLTLPENYYTVRMEGIPAADLIGDILKWCESLSIAAVATDTLGQARGDNGDVHRTTNKYFAALQRLPSEIAVSTSDHIPRADEDKKQHKYHTLSTGRTEAIARRVLSQRVVDRGHGFIDVRYLVNLDNYGPGGEEWYERVQLLNEDD